MIFAQACAYKGSVPVYQGSVKVWPDKYGVTCIEIYLDKGDTTTPWQSFNQITFTVSYPLSLDKT